jgi:hypothetical protein
MHRERQQQAEDAARGADRRIRRRVQYHCDDQVQNGRREDADEKVRQIEALAVDHLDLAAEHEDREHVDEQVPEVRMQEPVGRDLPDAEVRRADRPEPEPDDQRRSRQALDEKDRDVGQDQKLGARRNVHA